MHVCMYVCTWSVKIITRICVCVCVHVARGVASNSADKETRRIPPPRGGVSENRNARCNAIHADARHVSPGKRVCCSMRCKPTTGDSFFTGDARFTFVPVIVPRSSCFLVLLVSRREIRSGYRGPDQPLDQSRNQFP